MKGEKKFFLKCINIEGFLEALELTLLMLIDCDKTEE